MFCEEDITVQGSKCFTEFRFKKNLYKSCLRIKKIYFGDLSKQTALLTQGIGSTRNLKKVVIRSSECFCCIRHTNIF